jgi:DNA-binding Lrp family transcriptional regulator
MIDEKDREILKLLQDGFPLSTEPFKVIGDKLWIDEMTVISRLARLSQDGIIRHLGVFFNTAELGYKGTLAAMQVEEARVDQVAECISSFPQVTHNYLREGSPNLWFTIIAGDEAEMAEVTRHIKERTGVAEILLFPARKRFKVRTDMV